MFFVLVLVLVRVFVLEYDIGEEGWGRVGEGGAGEGGGGHPGYSIMQPVPSSSYEG